MSDKCAICKEVVPPDVFMRVGMPTTHPDWALCFRCFRTIMEWAGEMARIPAHDNPFNPKPESCNCPDCTGKTTPETKPEPEKPLPVCGTEVRTCPFCGNIPKVFMWQPEGATAAMCEWVDCPMHENAVLLEDWNRRAK